MPTEGVNPTEFPECVAYLWGWFMQLNAKRPQGMNGALPLPESEIGWFFRNRGLEPAVWEIDAIARLDLIALESFSKEK